jgi:hypothetical protein
MKSKEEIKARIKILKEAPDHGLISSIDEYALIKRIKELEWILED